MAETNAQIVFVDDDSIFHFILKKELEMVEHAYDLTFFLKPEDALKYIIENKDKVDLVFLDIFMPVMNGWELLENYLELTTPEERCKFYILSSSTYSLDLQKYNDYACIVDYLIKPISGKELVDKIQSALNA